MYAACVVAFVACANGNKFSVMYLILLDSVVHRHGWGTRLGTCLVYATCVMAIVAWMTGDEFCCPKSLHTDKQHTHRYKNYILVLQIAANNHARLQTRYQMKV